MRVRLYNPDTSEEFFLPADPILSREQLESRVEALKETLNDPWQAEIVDD